MNDHICNGERMRSPETTEHNLVIGGGGARVMPSAAGALCAFEKAGLKMETAGGVSGGFLVAVLLMSGLAPQKIARLSVEIVFQKLLSMRTLIGLFRAQIFRRVNERLLPLQAVFGSEKLGAWFEDRVGTMPERCWTIGVHGNHGSEYNLRPYLFTANGVFEQRDDYGYQCVSTVPLPVGIIVRSTCAVPGIIEPIQVNCEHRALCLFDGMLTAEGRSPINPILNYFHKERASIIAFDVGEEEPSLMTWLQDTVYEYWCRRCYRELSAVNKAENKDILVIRPRVASIASTQFRVQELPKLDAVVEGYLTAMQTLVDAHLAESHLLEEARSIEQKVQGIKNQCAGDKSIWWWQRKRCAVVKIKKLLAEHHLYDECA
jgi:predicted acylesterase/phospholipase RssA